MRSIGLSSVLVLALLTAEDASASPPPVPAAGQVERSGGALRADFDADGATLGDYRHNLWHFTIVALRGPVKVLQEVGCPEQPIFGAKGEKPGDPEVRIVPRTQICSKRFSRVRVLSKGDVWVQDIDFCDGSWKSSAPLGDEASLIVTGQWTLQDGSTLVSNPARILFEGSCSEKMK